MTICMGLIVVIFIGGVLNLGHLAYAPALDAIVVVGVLMAAASVHADRKSGNRNSNPGADPAGSVYSLLPGAILILGAFVFQTVWLLPPAAFNVYDDFQTYLSLPLRMLATGTLQPGPFSYFGVNTLGAHSYLQGFVAAHWPLADIDAVDALFGLTLAGCLILVVGRRTGTPAWLGLLAVVAVIVINPQYVNISTLYIGSALLIFLLLIPSGVHAQGQTIAPISATFAITTGLTYGALVVLKSTFVLPVLVHFLLVTASSAMGHRSLRRSATGVLQVALGGGIVALPWMLNQASKLIPALVQVGHLAGGGSSGLRGQNLGPGWLSTDPFIYGFGTGHIHYTALAIVALLCALFLVARIPWHDRPALSDRLTAIAGCLLLPVFYVIQMKVIGAKLMGADTALRYAAPVFIGVAPAAMLLAGGRLTTGSAGNTGRRTARYAPAAAAVLGLAAAFVVGNFSVSLVNR
ncbi:MAG TPA: hypothetical protein ENK16_04855, partial [Chromatiales bacterium]|nr:hypothetical protein [Chromatiales bacterium]